MFSKRAELNFRNTRSRMFFLVTLTILLTSTMAAATPTDESTSNSGSDDNDDILGNERIDYREQDIRVIREPDNKSRVSIKVGDDEFSVRWGDDSLNGAVELVSIQRRYLGVADIYNVNGEFEGRIGIPVEKLFRTEFPGIIEYADQDSDGMFGVISNGKAGSLNEILNDAAMTHEEVYKYVDLRNAEWSLRDWDNTSDTDSRNRSLSFTLVAENITYEAVRAGTMSDNTSKLDAVEITFYGTTREEVIDIESMPHYRVEVERGADDEITVKESRKIASSDVTGHVLKTTWKYDMRIRGWDGVAINDTLDGNDSRLFSVTEVATATRIDERVAEWMRINFENAIDPEAVIGHAKRKISDDPVGATYDTEGWLNVCEEGKITEVGTSGERVKMTPSEFLQREEQAKEVMKPENQVQAEDEEDDANKESKSRSGDTTGSIADDDKANKSRKERLLDAVDNRYDRVTGYCADHGELKDDAVRRATAIRGGGLYFEDSGAEFARLRWVNNVTVREEGEEMDFEVVYQIHGRRNVTQVDLPDNSTDRYRGVRLIGGFNYPVAEDIIHDPEVSSDTVYVSVFDDGFAATDSPSERVDTTPEPRLSEGFPGFTGFIAAAALFGAALVGRRRLNH